MARACMFRALHVACRAFLWWIYSVARSPVCMRKATHRMESKLSRWYASRCQAAHRTGSLFVLVIALQARTTGMSAQHVVYPGVRLSCFIVQLRRFPASPALAMNTVLRP